MQALLRSGSVHRLAYFRGSAARRSRKQAVIGWRIDPSPVPMHRDTLSPRRGRFNFQPSPRGEGAEVRSGWGVSLIEAATFNTPRKMFAKKTRIYSIAMQTINFAADPKLPSAQDKLRERSLSAYFHEQCEILHRSPRRPPQNDSVYEFFPQPLKRALTRPA